jgi:hypothetical protein
MMESSERARRLIGEILDNLRELSYETQRQDRVIKELREQLAAREAASPSANGSEVPVHEGSPRGDTRIPPVRGPQAAG